MQQEDLKTDSSNGTSTIDTSRLYQNPAELESILFSLTQPDNTQLKKATIILTDFLTKPQSVLPLLQQMEQSQKQEVRQMAAVYLREQVENCWGKIPKETQTKLKAFLITKLECEYRPERLAVAACIASVAKFELIHHEWESLLQCLSKMCDASVTSNSNMREIGVTIWRNIIQFCGGSLKKHFGIILSILSNALNDSQSLKTQVEAVKAIGLMVEFLENQNEIEIIENVIPTMCGVIERCLKAGDEDNVLAGMEVFNDLAESKIPILNKHSKQLVTFNTNIASAKGKLPMTVRKQAVNFLMWMAKSKPRTVIKCNFLKDFLQLAMNLVLENANMTDEEQQELMNDNLGTKGTGSVNVDSEDFVGFCSPLAMGCDLLDQIFKSMPSEVVFPMGVKAIESLMNQKTDSARQTAYTVIAMMIEGCELMIAKGNNLNILLDTTLKGSKDNNPLVRKCALEAITQLATHMHYKVLPHHKDVLPVLFGVFDRDNEDIRVVERALNAIEMFIDAFTEATEEERGDFTIEEYAPIVMKIVEKCLKSNVTELRTQSLTTIASVASAAKTKFTPYLDGTLKLLESAMKSTDARENENNNGQLPFTDEELANNVLLRAEATSCLGAVAVAVGADLYKPYFEEFHKTVLAGLNEIDDSNLREATFIYFSEIATILGEAVTGLESFEDMLVAILWIMADDDGVQVRMPDDGFGGSSKIPGFGDDGKDEQLVSLALEDTKLDDLQNMSEEELEALLKKTMLNAAEIEDNEDGDNDNDNDDDEADSSDEEDDERTKRIADSVGQLQTVKISVRTGFMEEKAAAIHCLTQFIRYGGDGMLQNLDTCFDALLRLWDYPHQLVKLALINCFHAFFTSIMDFTLKAELEKGNACYSADDDTQLQYKWSVGDTSLTEKYDESVKQYIEEMFPLYIQSIIDEDDNDTLNLLIDNFIEELRILGPASINEYMTDLVNAIKQFLNGKSALLKTGDDPNDEETQKVVTKHEFVIDAIAELISTQAELWGIKFMQIWSEIFPCLLKHAKTNKHPHDRAMVAGCIADVCSNLASICETQMNDNNNNNELKGAMSPYSDECFKLALTMAQSTDVNMRQNALYCIGALFTACNQQSNLQHSNDCLRCLQVYMKFPNDGTRGEKLVRDNAVSALGKVLVSEPEALPANELITAFIGSLPLTADFSENKYVYDVLMRLVIEEPELVKAYINKVLMLLSDALPSDKVSPKTTGKIITFFQKICADKGIQQVVKTLNQENQTNIMKALQQQQSN